MNILVTGSSGFIARFIIPLLKARGHVVRGIDKRAHHAPGDHFQAIQANILDEAAVSAAMQGIDLVLHLAAEHKDFGVTDELYHRVNVQGTGILLKQATQHRVKKFAFFSSVAVYGDQSVPTHEGMPTAPSSPYGSSKLLAEHAIRAWAGEEPGRQVLFVRPTVVFGPHNRENMYRLIQAVARRRYVGVGDGSNIKSIAYVDNVAHAAAFLMDQMHDGVETYNYADTPHLATRELASAVADHLRVPLPGIHIPKTLALACARPFDLIAKVTNRDLPLTAKRIDKFTRPTHHEATKVIGAGFKAPHALKDGIRQTVEWYLTDTGGAPSGRTQPGAA